MEGFGFPSAQKLARLPVDEGTGLHYSEDAHFEVRHLFQPNTGALRMVAGTSTVNSARVAAPITLDWYSQLRRTPEHELVVHFNGADMRDGSSPYPRFARVQSLKRLPNARSFLSFSDPTIVLGKERILLGWYLGGQDYDPLWDIAKVVRKAMQMTAASHVTFVGGSGGGIPALRIGALFPGSLVFLQDPQTSISKYRPSVRDAYFRSLWDGWNMEGLFHSFPDRFDMVWYYKMRQPENFVYYYQESRDTFHVERHYEPFVSNYALRKGESVDVTGRRKFALVEGAIPGHGKISGAEFRRHLDEALSWWRAAR